MKNHLESPSDTQNLEGLCRVAKLSNALAKRLNGEARTLAYRIKAEACSSLIVAGGARVNGVWPGDIVALDLTGSRPTRIHIRRSHLTSEARAVLEHEMNLVPVVTRMAERLSADSPALKRDPSQDPTPSERPDLHFENYERKA